MKKLLLATLALVGSMTMSAQDNTASEMYGGAQKTQDFLSQNKRFASNPDPNFYIYLCIGQSNMEGAANPEDQDYAWDNPRFQLMAAVDFPAFDPNDPRKSGRYRGEGRKMFEWSTAVPPLCRPGTGLTPVDYFGRTLVEKLPENIKVGVIHVAIGGCCIEHLFKEYDPASVVNEAGWFQNFMHSYNDLPYTRLLDCALRANKVGVIKGILFHQGCSNSGQEDWPMKVNHVYQDLLRDLNLKAEDCPLYAGEVVSEGVGGVCAGHNKIVRKLPEYIPTSRVISADGLPCAFDHLHFNAEGYREFGRRYAEEALKDLKK